MNKQQLFSLGVVGLLCLAIILTYNSWELWDGNLVIWLLILFSEILVLAFYFADWIIKEMNNGK